MSDNYSVEESANHSNKLLEIVSDYQRLIDIIRDNADLNGMCSLKKTEITKLYGLSYTGTNKKINFLVKYGLLADHKPGISVMNKDIIFDTPIKLVFEIHNLLLENPDVSNSFKRQSEILDAPLNDIQVAWGFLSYCFGSKYGGN